jgi:condensin-2 complex subunit H2
LAPGNVQEDLDPTQENPGQSNANKTEDNTNAGGNGWSYRVDHDFPGDYIPPDPDDLEDSVDPVGEDSDDEDPWKPLNPYEPGNLKIKPYRRGTGSCCGHIDISILLVPYKTILMTFVLNYFS